MIISIASGKGGTGKTTLLRILTGKESPDTGEFTFRNGVKTAFLEQVPELDNSRTIDELILSANTPVLTVIQQAGRGATMVGALARTSPLRP